jgi:DNA-directed RNA polymerase specialized sigma24 family protein
MADLKGMARSLLAREANAGSVHSTMLANSALKKLAPKSRNWSEITWESREAFFRDAHFSMRRLLVDYARRRTRRAHVLVGGFESEAVGPLVKTGVLDLDKLVVKATESVELAETIAAALEELERKYPDRPLAAVIQFRVFDGLGQAETAKLLQIGERTVREYEKLAYALLRKALRPYF